MLTEVEPLLPTRGYRVLCHDATLIDLQAEAMWPTGTQTGVDDHPAGDRAA